MMQAMREGVGRWVAMFILVLVGGGFIFFGIDFTTSTATTAARVNGESIPMLEFERVLQPQMTQYQQLYRSELTDDLRREIRRNVLEGIVNERALSQRVADAGYRASDSAVLAAIRSDERFQVNGQFSADILRIALSNNGVSNDQFAEQMRVQLALQDLQDGIANSTFLTPAEFRRYVELTRQQREIAYAHFAVDRFVENVEVTEDEIVAHYEANGALYMSAETVDFEYVEVSLADIAANTAVSEQELREYYDSERDLFATEEERRVSHILIDEDDEAAAEARAEEVLARLDAGEAFEDLAAELSDDPGTRAAGGDLGRFVRGMIPGAFEDAVFSMSEGEVSGPVRSEFGVHVIRVDSISAGDTQSFENVRDDLLSQLRAQRAEDEFYEIANALGDRAYYSDGDLAEVAAELMLPLVSVEGFGRSGDPEMFDNSQQIVEAVFSDEVLREGRNSNLIELGEGDALVLRVTEHHEAEQQPLDEVRELVGEELLGAKAAELARAAAQEFFDAVTASDDPAALAESHGGIWRDRKWIRRDDGVTPPQVVARVFALGAPQDAAPVWESVPLPDGGEAVVALYAIEAGVPESISRDERDAQQLQLSQQTGFAELSAYIEAVREQADVVITPEALDPVYY